MVDDGLIDNGMVDAPTAGHLNETIANDTAADIPLENVHTDALGEGATSGPPASAPDTAVPSPSVGPAAGPQVPVSTRLGRTVSRPTRFRDFICPLFL